VATREFSRLRRSILLITDGIINLGLGILLLTFPAKIVTALGVPTAEESFYPNILGAVFFGIGVALFLELHGKGFGLSLVGAITINLCGGFVLALWLLFGDLSIPIRGHVFLWVLVIILVGISLVELFVAWRGRNAAST
jgi:hypothetical protein